VKLKLSKRKTINLRPLENDLEKIKTEAIKAGMPYQTLIRCYYSSIC
jgi:predicted DNA binding CopG/RHH family protein